MHVGLLGGGFLLLLGLHFVFARRADRALMNIAGKREGEAPAEPKHAPLSSIPQAARREPRPPEAQTAVPFWPRQAARNVSVCLLALAAIFALALLHGWSDANLHRGAALGSPADLSPLNSFDAARPEWAFRGLYQFAQFFPERQIVPIFVIPTAILLLYFALPLVGRSLLGRLFYCALTAVLLTGLIGVSSLSYYRDARDPKQQQALAEERFRANRAIELANAKGIPPGGAWRCCGTIAKRKDGESSCKTRASCHDWTDANGIGIAAEKPSAPNLHGYASREWIAGLLDPKQILTPKYFGGTKLRGGMIDFVRKDLRDRLKEDEDEKQNLQKVVIALSAEAQLPSQREMDRQDGHAIDEGRTLIVEDFVCVDCHKFRDHGKLGMAPDLTGYGSKAWIAAFTSNPKSKRFYGEKNDRMPSYAENADASKNLLGPHALDMLSDWLRGDWFKE